MIVSVNDLRRDTLALLRDINAQIDAVQEEALKQGIAPVQMRDRQGNWVLSPLLLAKATAHATLVQLQTKK